MRLVDRPTNIPRVRRRSLLGQIVLTLLGVQLLFLASFTSVDVPIATKRNMNNFCLQQMHDLASCVPPAYLPRVQAALPVLKQPVDHLSVRRSAYTPLVAVAIFLGYVLGMVIGPISCAIFIAVGLLGPLVGIHAFAGGGGVAYYLEPGFGYLLALIGASWIAGLVTDGKRTSLSQLSAVFAGLTVIHLTGLVYLLGSCLVSYLVDGSRTSLAWQPWVFELARNMTWYPLPYDIITSLVLIALGFPFRWLASALIAPDLVPKPGPQNGIAGASRAGMPRHRVPAGFPTEVVEDFV
ncbi:MAG: biotin transporter BioY [Cyanobacteria bacterium REEB67]|nr:biotin transporter BioY [Cyanobacteria bacterium REEB67]